MAISKILNMKDCGGHFHGKHLKRSLDYVMNPEKTQDGRLVGAINCQVDSAFEQMKATKRKFGKVDKRQGYHIILSFKEDEVNPDTAFEITRRFVEEYLGKSYEAVYVVHDNTAHVHSHIVFNSVSFVDGKKYRYEKGDWAKYIQPITNKLCQEYGLSIIDVDDGSKEKEHESYKDWSEYREGSFVWADMIKRDLDSCILQAGNYEQFLELLSDKGYEVKQGKYLAVKPQGMTRFRRCKTLGDMYSDEAIRERIEKEDISFYREMCIRDRYTTYPSKVEHTSFFTDEDGDLILPEALKIGNYRIEEVSAPFGYVVNDKYINISVDTDTAFETDGDTNDAIITLEYSDAPAVGELTVEKKGEVLEGFKGGLLASSYEKEFVYKEGSLAGAKFKVYAADDIYTADNQKDADGNRIKYYSKGDLVTTLTTGKDGKATAKNLPLGQYRVVEVEAPYGYVLNPNEQKVCLLYTSRCV